MKICPTTGAKWIDGITEIVLTPIDQEPHPGGIEDTFYRVIWLEDPIYWDYCYVPELCDVWTPGEFPGSWETYTEPFLIPEESCHIIEYYSVDLVGNQEDLKWQCVFADHTPPTLSVQTGQLSIPDSGFEWIKQDTPIYLECVDEGPHPSDDVTIFWSYTVDGGPAVTGSYQGTYYELFFPEDSMHELEVWCKDAVEKESDHEFRTYKVDTTEPVITKTMIGNYYPLDECPPVPGTADECFVADNGNSGVHIEAHDEGPICAVGIDYCYYEVIWYHDDTSELVDSGQFTDYADVLFTEDSTHEIYVYCVDWLGNWVDDLEEFKVDSLPPVTVKEYGLPFIMRWAHEIGWGLYPHWITSSTPITFTASDVKVGVDTLNYRITLLDVNDSECMPTCQFEGTGDWTVIDGDHVSTSIPEESCHLIEFYSVDLLGNTEVTNRQCVFVDNTPPTGNKDVGEPSIFIGEGGDCVETPQVEFTASESIPEGTGATVDPASLVVTLGPEESVQEHKVITTAEVPIQNLDVVFLFDLTGSMGGVLNEAKTNAIDIMTDINAEVANAAFGVGSFMDYTDIYDYCGYLDLYGVSPDYPWSLDQDITQDNNAVSTAINGLTLGSGSDGPEAYSRALSESLSMGWRTGSRRVVIIFEDNIPHDCNVGNYPGDNCDMSTSGVDPGPDGIAGTADDLAWADVVADLTAAGITVVAVDSSLGLGCTGPWEYAVTETGGILSELTDSANLPDQIVGLIETVTTQIGVLTLEPSVGFES